METETCGISFTCDELCGNVTCKPFGAICVDVTMKNISNRNTMSVIDDILKLVPILFLATIAIMPQVR